MSDLGLPAGAAVASIPGAKERLPDDNSGRPTAARPADRRAPTSHMKNPELKRPEPRRGTMLKFSQTFGPTVQDEGSAAGQHCLFVRTFGCNLECAFVIQPTPSLNHPGCHVTCAPW